MTRETESDWGTLSPPIRGSSKVSELERIVALESDLRHLRKDINLVTKIIEKNAEKLNDIHEKLVEARGGYKVLMAAAAVSGTLSALAVKLIPWAGLFKP